jgi:hypothetical protein
VLLGGPRSATHTINTQEAERGADVLADIPGVIPFGIRALVISLAAIRAACVRCALKARNADEIVSPECVYDKVRRNCYRDAQSQRDKKSNHEPFAFRFFR